MFILGIEGTAWNLGAAIVNETEIIAEVTETYKPESGGIHPREAAQHHAKYAAAVLKKLLAEARGKGIEPSDIDGIAEIIKIMPGTYNMSVSLASYATQILKTVIEKGKVIELDVKMTKA